MGINSTEVAYGFGQLGSTYTTSGADAIVVLSGGKATRIPHALKLFAENYSPRLLFTDEKNMNLRFAHLFLTNEEIAAISCWVDAGALNN